MKTTHILFGLLICGFLSGCALDEFESTSRNVSKPDSGTPPSQNATFTVMAATNGALLSYQWQFNGTNISGVTNRCVIG